VDDCWWLNSLPVSEETEFYVVVHCSGELSPFDLTSQMYRGVNISFTKTDTNGIFRFTTGKVCIMSGKING
jgi:hypothetical protein